MKQKTAQQFSDLWTELGEQHTHMEEAELIEKEAELFSLKSKLSGKDVPYILEHIDQSHMVQKALLGFLR